MENLIIQNESFNRSNKYQNISTKNVLASLESEGYQLNSFNAAKVRNKSKNGFQKHLLRISRSDFDLDIEGLRPEIIIINSHDGSSSFKMLVGVYRFACANGLIVGSSYFERNVRHIGDAWSKVLTSIEEVKHALPLVSKDIQRFSQVELTRGKQIEFAESIAKHVAPKDSSPVNVESLLRLRRHDDQNPDLFTVLNVVQENVLKGNISFETKKDNGTVIRKARAIKSLTRTTEINQLIWNTASGLVA